MCDPSERLLKFQLEELREFLQEQLAVSFFLPDDEVVEQLQDAMSELRGKKLDQPPPGASTPLLLKGPSCHLHLLLLLLPAKSEELPKKTLGQERVLILPLQPNSPLEVKLDLHLHAPSESPPVDQAPSQAPPPESRSFGGSNAPSPDPFPVHTQECGPPPLPPKAKKPCTGESVPQVGRTEDREEQEEEEEESADWPPPYEPPDLDALTMHAEEIMDLPDLPPPPLFYPPHHDQQPAERQAPCPQARLARMSPPPKLSPKPHVLLPSKPSPPRSSPPRLPPTKPTKFPVSLYVPLSAGDRRPSNTSQYDNLSEADEDERPPERLLASTPEEAPSVHVDQDYDPALFPLPPPPLFIPPSPSPIPPSLGALSSLPQEPEYNGEDSWVEDAIIPPPPPSFADRLAPYQCSDTHRAASPSSYSKPFSRGPRDYSAFPAPLLYTRSPQGFSRPPGQSAVGGPLVRSSPDFCRMPPGGQQLPKSVTF